MVPLSIWLHFTLQALSRKIVHREELAQEGLNVHWDNRKVEIIYNQRIQVIIKLRKSPVQCANGQGHLVLSCPMNYPAGSKELRRRKVGNVNSDSAKSSSENSLNSSLWPESKP